MTSSSEKPTQQSQWIKTYRF